MLKLQKEKCERQMALSDFDGVCTANIMVFDIKNYNKMIHRYLSMVIQSDVFVNYATETSVGSLFPNAKWAYLSKFSFPLPPLHEQHLIADLFQSIEQSIESNEKQEGNLRKLKKSLCNGLVNKPPMFGNLLLEKNLKLVNFSEIADCIEQHDKKPLENGITRFIGLENIEAENFQLHGSGDIANGTTFTKRFSKGDVLFGKRRAYLKKVAVADFDGICSGDILVFRAKENIKIELLSYYVCSEAFITHAVKTSAGSLSPRTKWKDLSIFEIFILEMKAQDKIAEIFTQLEKTIIKIKTQIQTLKTLKQKLLNEILSEPLIEAD